MSCWRYAKEFDQFGDIVQSHRLHRIHGPEKGKINTIPYEFRSEPELGTCVLTSIIDNQITDDRKAWSTPDLPPPQTKLSGDLILKPPANAQTTHDGFTVNSRLINSFAMTTSDAELRGHPGVEHTTVGARYPIRHLRLAVFFPAGYQPMGIRVEARRTEASRPLEQCKEDTDETARVTPNLFFDRDRGFVVLSMERYLPEYHYLLRWKLPDPPAPPPWNEVTQARDQVQELLDLGARPRSDLERGLCAIRDAVCEEHLGWGRNRQPKARLSLLAFDEAARTTRVVLTTMDDAVRNVTFGWGVGVAGWVMRRRRPAFVDTRDSHTAGIYHKAKGAPPDRYLLCVPLPLPLPLPAKSETGNKLLLNRAMPCLVAALSTADERGKMSLLKEPSRPANVEWDGPLAKLSSALVDKVLDLISGMLI